MPPEIAGGLHSPGIVSILRVALGAVVAASSVFKRSLSTQAA
jgi:hypothetical protein